MIELLLLILEQRRKRFAPGNNRLWPGGWVECPRCPDGNGFPSFHSVHAHE